MRCTIPTCSFLSPRWIAFFFPNQEGDEEGDEDEVVEEAPPEEEEEVPLVPAKKLGGMKL